MTDGACKHPARRGNSGSRPAAMSPTPGPPGQQREAQTHPARRGNSGRTGAPNATQHPARRGNSGRAGAPNATPGPPGQQREYVTNPAIRHALVDAQGKEIVLLIGEEREPELPLAEPPAANGSDGHEVIIAGDETTPAAGAV